jgi:hypothetical protein
VHGTHGQLAWCHLFFRVNWRGRRLNAWLGPGTLSHKSRAGASAVWIAILFTTSILPLERMRRHVFKASAKWFRNWYVDAYLGIWGFCIVGVTNWLIPGVTARSRITSIDLWSTEIKPKKGQDQFICDQDQPLSLMTQICFFTRTSYNQPIQSHVGAQSL